MLMAKPTWWTFPKKPKTVREARAEAYVRMEERHVDNFVVIDRQLERNPALLATKAL